MNKLYINQYISDNELYTGLYNRLFSLFGIYKQDEYQFIYDEFLEHLILDCTKLVEKNFDPTKKSKPHLYKMEAFKKIFMDHLTKERATDNAWYDKIMRPDKCPEIIKRLRKYKLEKININYGN